MVLFVLLACGLLCFFFFSLVTLVGTFHDLIFCLRDFRVSLRFSCGFNSSENLFIFLFVSWCVDLFGWFD